MGTSVGPSPERVEVTSRAELRRWLARHHASSTGIWIVTYKKGQPGHVSWDEVVEELLCVGWIDSKPAKLDATRSMLRCAPRKPRSGWSAINKARVARLIATRRMKRAGLAAIERARRDGSWTALDAAHALVEPPDLVQALADAPTARRAWDAFPPSARRGILEWIGAARRPETRAARIGETVREARAGRRANQWPRSR